jgi:hypothetical protein
MQVLILKNIKDPWDYPYSLHACVQVYALTESVQV